MKEKFHDQLLERSRVEPFSRLLGMEAMEVGPGRSMVRMRLAPGLANIFGTTHGGVLFSLLDEAFQLASNSHGVLSVALNVSITYHAAPKPEALLEARATEIHKTKRTASYSCDIRELPDDRLIATAQALAYRTGKELEL